MLLISLINNIFVIVIYCINFKIRCQHRVRKIFVSACLLCSCISIFHPFLSAWMISLCFLPWQVDNVSRVFPKAPPSDS